MKLQEKLAFVRKNTRLKSCEIEDLISLIEALSFEILLAENDDDKIEIVIPDIIPRCKTILRYAAFTEEQIEIICVRNETIMMMPDYYQLKTIKIIALRNLSENNFFEIGFYLLVMNEDKNSIDFFDETGIIDFPNYHEDSEGISREFYFNKDKSCIMIFDDEKAFKSNYCTLVARDFAIFMSVLKVLMNYTNHKEKSLFYPEFGIMIGEDVLSTKEFS